MDNIEKVEQLVAKAGCSYAEAKEALEASEWDLLDAIILLENSGKAINSSASYKTESGEATYVEAEVVSSEEASKIMPESFAEKNSAGNSAKESAEARKKKAREAWEKFKDICTRNRMLMFSSSNAKIFDLPIWIPALCLICWFWGVLILVGITMLFGCRLQFSGRDLGGSKINEAMDAAADTAVRAAEKVKQSFQENNNNDNEGTNTDN
ncbi:MAG TPA: hypothetical protein PLO47_03355 [Bacillota bacterium]|nr:hypothetical protein [Bacillota bacterium]